MKRVGLGVSVTVISLFLSLLCPLLAQGQQLDEYSYRFQSAGSGADRYLGNSRAGSITAGSVSVDISDSNRVHRMSLEYEDFENKVSDQKGLELPEEKFSLGFDHPVGQGCHLVLAGNMYRYNISDPYWAFGVYPNREWSSGWATADSAGWRMNRIATGLERDIDATTLGYAYVRWHSQSAGWFAGASNEKYIETGRVAKEHKYSRIGSAVLWRPGDQFTHFFFGSTYNIETEQPTWVAGLAKIVSVHQSGLRPAGMLIVREKPEAFYVLGIATLWGSTLNDFATPGIFESFYRGSFNQSRVVRNRDFNTVGVGKSYDAQDFGRLSLTGTYMDIEAGSTRMIAEEYALYRTRTQPLGPIARPYLGLAYSHETDLIYNNCSHRLENPSHRWYTVYLGGKLPLISRPDPYRRAQNGYLRLESGFRFYDRFEGVFLETTFWY